MEGLVVCSGLQQADQPHEALGIGNDGDGEDGDGRDGKGRGTDELRHPRKIMRHISEDQRLLRMVREIPVFSSLSLPLPLPTPHANAFESNQCVYSR